MGQVGDLIGTQGAAAAGVLGPAEHPGLEEGAIDDQLTAALEQIEQAYLALGSVELVLLVHSQPRHPPAVSASRERVKAFSFTRSRWRAASHSCCDTIGGVLIARCPFPCSLSLSLLVAISFLLCFLKQTETIRSEKFSELADAHRQNSSRGSC